MGETPSWLEGLRAAQAVLARGDAQGCLDALATLRRKHPDDELCRALALEARGRALFALHQPDAAVEALAESLHLLRVCKGASASLTLGVMQNLSFALQGLGRLDESIELAAEAARGLEASLGPDAPQLAECLLRLSSSWYRKGNFDRAETLMLRAQAIWEKLGDAEKLGTCLNNLGRIHEERGQLAEGILLHRRALAVRQAAQGEHEDTAFSHGNLGVALATAGQWDEAIEHLRAAVDMYDRVGKGGCPEARGYRDNLELCLKARDEA